jgi:hypothetical protein
MVYSLARARSVVAEQCGDQKIGSSFFDNIDFLFFEDCTYESWLQDGSGG